MLWLIVSTGAYSSVGGARPKALFDDDGRPLIAKFSSPTDTFPWMPAEAVAMKLARHGSYAELADVIRRQFVEPKDTLVELFSRIVFNVLLGNTDDHPRNHAAFWDGTHATPTPAYDTCTQPRSGGEAAQAMVIGRDGQRRSRLDVCVDAAEVYLLEPPEARDIVERLTTVEPGARTAPFPGMPGFPRRP